MQVKLTTSRAGLCFENHAGEVIDLPREEALRLVRAGSAEMVEPETADNPPTTETTMRPTGRKGRQA